MPKVCIEVPVPLICVGLLQGGVELAVHGGQVAPLHADEHLLLAAALGHKKRPDPSSESDLLSI